MEPRVQLALNVTNLDAAISFYNAMFGAEPAKRRPGYANYALSTPPLKLVLIEGPIGGTVNHLGVEVGSTEEVRVAGDRLESSGLVTLSQDATDCCYAVQDKTWVTDPDGAAWEWYTVLADSHTETFEASTIPEPAATASACCVATATACC
jgi:catechol 2,3-dioxygenase-like lactoylglutathione lyase family enzyme